MDKGIVGGGFLLFSTAFTFLIFGLCVGYYYGMAFAAM